MFKAKLFGTPQISLGNQSLSGAITGRKLALLSYLLITDKPCDRGVLADLLWCDLSEDQARKNLRNLIYSLRSHLHDYLSITNTTIALKQEGRHWSDVNTFVNYMTSEFPAADADILPEILKLYQGELLAGVVIQEAPRFEAWIAMQRNALHDQVMQGFHWLGDYYLARRAYTDGLVVTRQALTLAPWCETSHRQQMLLLAASGQPQAALTQYERCRQMLVAEYDAEPLPETTALYQQIKSNAWVEPNLQLRFTWQLARSRPEMRINWEAIPQQPQLYGREDEINALAHWLHTELCPLIAVVGLPGQGKTALLAEMILRVVEADKEQMDDAPVWQRTAVTPARPQVDQIFWYSVAGAPSLARMLDDWLQWFAPTVAAETPAAVNGGGAISLERQLTLLVDHLRRKRCLLVLDQVESVLESRAQGGGYQQAYAHFGEFLRRICAAKLTSSVILLSRVELPEFALLRQRHSAVRVLPLLGLSSQAGVTLFQRQGITGDAECIEAFVEQVAGHPLALTQMVELCRTLSLRTLPPFFANERLIFGKVHQHLQQQVQQLTEPEWELLIWLAYRREPVAVDTLWQRFALAHLHVATLEALSALRRQSLVMLNQQTNMASLPQIVLAFMREQVIEQLLHEISQLCHQFAWAERGQSGESWYNDQRQRRGQPWLVAAERPIGTPLQVNGFSCHQHELVSPMTVPLPMKNYRSLPRHDHLLKIFVKQFHLNRYPLVAPQAITARQSEQRRWLVQPLRDRLDEQWGEDGTQYCLQNLLTLMEKTVPADGYLVENLRQLSLPLDGD